MGSIFLEQESLSAHRISKGELDVLGRHFLRNKNSLFSQTASLKNTDSTNSIVGSFE